MMLATFPRVCVLVLLGALGTARAAELSAQEIVDKALLHNSFGFENAVAKVTLILHSKGGSARTRQVEIRSAQKDGLGKTLVRFHAPADVAGTGFLVLENDTRDDDQYLYLPELGKVKRISGSQRNQRFMGTDMTYADLESRNLRKSKSTRRPDTKLGPQETYVIESIPDGSEDTEYGKTITYIHKTSFVPLQVEFFDKALKPLKNLKVRRLEKKDGQWIVMDSLIENLQQETRTEMKVDSLDLGARLGDEQFTQEALKSG